MLPNAPAAATSSAPAAGTRGRRQKTKAPITTIAMTNVSVPHAAVSTDKVG